MAFIDTHSFAGAFVANRLERLAEVIVMQGETLLTDAGIEFPPRTASIVLLIGERGSVSVADVARVLEQPHQLVTQRLELLLELGIVERVADPDDGRRWILRFTRKGSEQHRQLKEQLALTAQAFSDLFKEIGCDVELAIEQASRALARTSLAERVKAMEGERSSRRAGRR